MAENLAGIIFICVIYCRTGLEPRLDTIGSGQDQGSVKAQKRNQELIAKWPEECSTLLVPDPFPEPPLFVSLLTEY